MSYVGQLLMGMQRAAGTIKGRRCHKLIDRWFSNQRYSAWIFGSILRPVRNKLEAEHT